MKALPPWLALPQEVRTQVIERFKEVTGREPGAYLGIDPLEALQDLGKSRLIEWHGGDVKAAIRYAAEHGAPEYGSDPKEWRKAARRAKERIEKFASDPELILEGRLLHQLVAEEMAKRN